MIVLTAAKLHLLSTLTKRLCNFPAFTDVYPVPHLLSVIPSVQNAADEVVQMSPLALALCGHPIVRWQALH